MRAVGQGLSTRASVALGVAVVVGGVGMAGCAGSGVLGGGGDVPQDCVSWVDLATPAAALAEADLVVSVDGVTPAGTARTFGAEAAVHAVTVRAVLAGSGAAAGDVVEVVSTPTTCTADGVLYPGGDPLAAGGALVVFLHDDDAVGWRTITPRHGVVTAAPDGGLPERWDDAG